MTLDGFLLGMLGLAALGILAVFVLYPLAVLCLARLRPAARAAAGEGELPSVSVLVALRNAEALALDKLRNTQALSYPHPLQVVFVSDGSTDGTVRVLRAAGEAGLEVLELATHHGKAAALNLGAERCTGELLVLSDADAWLAPDALLALAARFREPGVGGVCGQRVIREQGELVEAQGTYIAADSALKRAESRIGNVTSNDGKLYAVRRALFRPIAPGATDDLYTCLSVVEQGARFVFEPRARAFIKTPSRGPAHELGRRRRIVARSLRGIYLKRALLNPLRHGAFALQLLVNKVLRRLLPVCLVAFALASAGLAVEHAWARVLVALELAFLALALSGGLLRWPPALSRLASTARYFVLGNLGTLLGLLDFLRRKETVRWDPLKAD